MHTFLLVEILGFPHTQICHQQPSNVTIADQQMDKDKVYTTCEAFHFTFLFEMNNREF
jgi:hypothetical protein